MTKDIIDEIIKCREDITYFILKYVKIEINGTYQNIEQLTPAQEKILESYKNNMGTVYESGYIYDCSGKSTIGLAILLYKSLFEYNRTFAVIVPNNQMRDTANRSFRAMVELLPPFFQQIRDSNRDLVRFENGNVVHFILLKEHNLRGMKLSYILFDEPAYSHNFTEDFIHSVIPVLFAQVDSKILFLSRETLKPSYWDKFIKYVLITKNSSIKYVS